MGGGFVPGIFPTYSGTNVNFGLLSINDWVWPKPWTLRSLVARFYAPLYQFAFSLTRSEPDACDLTQQTFTIWATKGHQLRDASKVKTWLFTTLHREYLALRRRQTRFPHFDLETTADELPAVLPTPVNRLMPQRPSTPGARG